jgi:hypothetical protein
LAKGLKPQGQDAAHPGIGWPCRLRASSPAITAQSLGRFSLKGVSNRQEIIAPVSTDAPG